MADSPVDRSLRIRDCRDGLQTQSLLDLGQTNRVMAVDPIDDEGDLLIRVAQSPRELNEATRVPEGRDVRGC